MSDAVYLTSPRLDLPGVRHAFFTRQGGVSAGVYESLNVGLGSGDDPGAVRENRRRAAAAFRVDAVSLLTAYQIHSDIVHIVDSPWGDERPEGDAIVTRTPGLICGALSADCAPVLLADPDTRIVASAHAGWRGALAGVVERTVDAMAELGAEVTRVVAVVGPCIGPDSYEVGPEHQAAFIEKNPDHARHFRPGAGDRLMFDLPAFVLSRLHAAGVRDAEWIGRDTCAEEATFFSNRRAFKRGEGDYGRLLSAIMLD
jgi:hypothetical protein